MRKRKSPLGLIFLVIFLLGLAVAGFRLYPDYQKSRFGKFDRFNLVIAGQTTFLVSLDLTGKSAVVMKFPNDLYLTELVHGYGQYKISSVYAAGNLDRRGGETLSGTVSEYLGVPVESYFYSSKDASDIKKFFLNNLKTNVSLFDRLRIILFLLPLRPDKIKIINLDKLASPLILADGSKALGLEKSDLDNNLAGIFTEQKLQAENLRTEVVNTTRVAGLGARATRLLANIGLSVVNIENGNLPIAGCQIHASPKTLNSLTVARIAAVYSCTVAKKSDAGRTEITVMLGQNYVDWLTK